MIVERLSCAFARIVGVAWASQRIRRVRHATIAALRSRDSGVIARLRDGLARVELPAKTRNGNGGGADTARPPWSAMKKRFTKPNLAGFGCSLLDAWDRKMDPAHDDRSRGEPPSRSERTVHRSRWPLTAC